MSLTKLLILCVLSLSSLVCASLIHSLDSVPVIYFTIARRGGAMNATLDAQVNVDFDYLSQELQKTEGRFNLTKREFKGNKLVRKAQSRGAANKAEGLLMGEVALDGLW